jgi:hypothetical protein
MAPRAICKGYHPVSAKSVAAKPNKLERAS